MAIIFGHTDSQERAFLTEQDYEHEVMTPERYNKMWGRGAYKSAFGDNKDEKPVLVFADYDLDIILRHIDWEAVREEQEEKYRNGYQHGK